MRILALPLYTSAYWLIFTRIHYLTDNNIEGTFLVLVVIWISYFVNSKYTFLSRKEVIPFPKQK